MNKRGLLKLLEAIIAIMIVLSVVLIIYFDKNNVKITDEREISSALIVPILEKISMNTDMRSKVLSYDITAENGGNELIISDIEGYIVEDFPSRFEFEIKICSPSEICPLNYIPYESAEIYSSERIISSNIDSNTFEPRKIKIFVWDKI